MREKRDLLAKKQEVIDKIDEMKKFSKEKWGVTVRVRVVYKLDTEREYGSYCPNHKVIDLNKDLLEEYGKLYIDDVVVHEFVHALVDAYFPSGFNGRKRVMDHGKEFKAFCSHFGNDGKATTSLFSDSKLKNHARKMAMFEYKCSCRTHTISKIKHNKILRGQERICRYCKDTLIIKER
jgi:SprT protein